MQSLSATDMYRFLDVREKKNLFSDFDCFHYQHLNCDKASNNQKTLYVRFLNFTIQH